jgi:hypothetical protein
MTINNIRLTFGTSSTFVLGSSLFWRASLSFHIKQIIKLSVRTNSVKTWPQQPQRPHWPPPLRFRPFFRLCLGPSLIWRASLSCHIKQIIKLSVRTNSIDAWTMTHQHTHLRASVTFPWTPCDHPYIWNMKQKEDQKAKTKHQPTTEIYTYWKIELLT